MSTPRRRSLFVPSLSELEGRKLMAGSVTSGVIPPAVQTLIGGLQNLENDLLSAASHSHNTLVTKLDTALANAIQVEINQLVHQFGGSTTTSSGGGSGGGTTAPRGE